MKQRENLHILLPAKRPEMLSDVHAWHMNLFNVCLFYEFKLKAINAALERVRGDIAHHIDMRKDGLEKPADLALVQLNKLKQELESERADIKGCIDIIHDTNEAIIASLLSSSGGRKFVESLAASPAVRGTNLLHGDGWMHEVLSAELGRKDGGYPFITFGTMFDPVGFDVICVPGPDRAVELNFPFSDDERPNDV
jgi:hypothetical protein